MTRLRITPAGYTFIAETNPDAPQTVAAILKLLPYRQKLVHVRWSGEGCWIPLEEEKQQHGDCSLWLFQDNEITLGVVTNDSEPAVKAVDHIR